MDAAAAAATDVGGAPGPLGVRARHIRKRALRNKSLSVSFNEKDLKDFVGGFHKRKKKRRKEAVQQQEEAKRRKRIELRKKRKSERDFVMFGGAAPPESGQNGDEADEEHEHDHEHEHDEDSEPVASISGTMMYDNEGVQVIVTTSEITREEVNPVKSDIVRTQSVDASENSKQKIPPTKKKQVKTIQRKRSRPKQQSKREKRKGKKKNDK